MALHPLRIKQMMHQEVFMLKLYLSIVDGCMVLIFYGKVKKAVR